MNKKIVKEWTIRFLVKNTIYDKKNYNVEFTEKNTIVVSSNGMGDDDYEFTINNTDTAQFKEFKKELDKMVNFIEFRHSIGDIELGIRLNNLDFSK